MSTPVTFNAGLIIMLLVSGCEHHKWMLETLIGEGEERDTCKDDFLILDEESLEKISHCETIGGDLDLHYLSNLDMLSNLSKVEGNIKIKENTSLSNLDGLSNLMTIEGYLSIRENDALADLNGLSNLVFVGDYLEFWGNDALSDLMGPSNIENVNGKLIIQSNDALTSLDGISPITTFGDALEISYNHSLCQSIVDAFLELFPNNNTDGWQNDDSC